MRGGGGRRRDGGCWWCGGVAAAAGSYPSPLGFASRLLIISALLSSRCCCCCCWWCRRCSMAASLVPSHDLTDLCHPVVVRSSLSYFFTALRLRLSPASPPLPPLTPLCHLDPHRYCQLSSTLYLLFLQLSLFLECHNRRYNQISVTEVNIYLTPVIFPFSLN